MMKFIFISLFFLLTLVACQSPYHGQEKKSINEIYIASGAEQYFLPELPAWANVSEIAECRRMDNIRFLDFTRLNKSYNLDFEKLLQLQLMFNNNLKKMVINFDKIDRYSNAKKDEELLFFNSLDKVQGGVKDFLAPDFKQIHLVWIDDFINDKTRVARLKNLLASESFSAGFPVFISTCLSYREMERFLVENEMAEQSIKLISSEFLTPFQEDYNLGTHQVIQIGKLFKETQTLFFYTTKNTLPREFKGPLKLKKF